MVDDIYVNGLSICIILVYNIIIFKPPIGGDVSIIILRGKEQILMINHALSYSHTTI